MIRDKRILIVIALLTPLFLVGLASALAKRVGLLQELRELKRQAERVGKENEELQSFLQYFSLRASLEREARSRLNLAKQGETLVIFVEATPAPQPEVKKESTFFEKIINWFKNLSLK